MRIKTAASSWISSSLNKMKKHWEAALLALPAFIILLLFDYIPMGRLVLAFKNLLSFVIIIQESI